MHTLRAFAYGSVRNFGDIEPLNSHDDDFENRERLVRAELGDTRLHLLPAFSPPEASLVQAHLGSVRVPA